MEEQTTTGEVETTSGAQAVPETPTETAGSDQEGSKDSSSEAASTSESTPGEVSTEAPEENLDEWLKNKGVDPSDPEATKKVAKMLKDTEKMGHAKAKEASELRKRMDELVERSTADDLSSDDPVRQELGAMKRELANQAVRNFTRDFYGQYPELQSYDEQIAELVVEKPYLAQDAEALASVARGRFLTDSEIRAAEERTRTETLEAVNKQQRASGPSPSASNSASPRPKITREWIASLSPTEYRTHKEEILAAMRSGEL